MYYLSLFLHADVAGCVDMPVQVRLCCHTSTGTLIWMCLCRCMSACACADVSVQTCLCRCTCVDLHLWVQPCGHASVGELCGHACSGAFKMLLQMDLYRHASVGNLCECAYGGTCLVMSWQMPLLVHLRCLCRGACGNVLLQAHLCGHASLRSRIQVYLASFLPVWKWFPLLDQMAAIGLPHLRLRLVTNIHCYPFVFSVSVLTCTSVTLVPSTLNVKAVCTLEMKYPLTRQHQ